jgi:hypothetical protein
MQLRDDFAPINTQQPQPTASLVVAAEHIIMDFASASMAPTLVEDQEDSILDSIEFDEAPPFDQSTASPVSPPPFSPFLPPCPFGREGAPSPEPMLKYAWQITHADEPNLDAPNHLNLGHDDDGDEKTYINPHSLEPESEEADLIDDDVDEEIPFAPPPSPEDDYYLSGAAVASRNVAAPPPAIQTDWARVCNVCRLACGGTDNCLLRFNDLVDSLDVERRGEAKSQSGEVLEDRKRRLSTDRSTIDPSLSPPAKRRKRSPSEERGMTLWRIPEYQAPARRDRSPSCSGSPKGRYPFLSTEPEAGYVPRSPDFSPNPGWPQLEETSRLSSDMPADEHSDSSWSIEAVHGSIRGSEGEDEGSEDNHSNLDRATAPSPPLQQSPVPSLASSISWSEFFGGAEENQPSQNEQSLYSQSSDEANQDADSKSLSLQSRCSRTTTSDESANN